MATFLSTMVDDKTLKRLQDQRVLSEVQALEKEVDELCTEYSQLKEGGIWPELLIPSFLLHSDHVSSCNVM